ncbi:MAG: DUF6263 family protein [Fuerstiella sp.]
MPVRYALLLILTGFLTGCGSSDAGSEDDGSVLSDILADIDLTEGGPADDGDAASAAADLLGTIDSSERTDRGEPLALKLSPGDRFPLVKTVEQTLVQKSAQFPATANSRLELHMQLQVQNVQPDGILFSVRYTRVVCTHDINGQQAAFDSASVTESIPVDFQPYAGMVNNGFQFRLGPDNKVREVLGYQQFLETCVRNVSADRRETLLADIRSHLGADSVAHFVDDAIGMLPYNPASGQDGATHVAVGDQWIQERRLSSSAPVSLQSTCRLTSMNAQTAEIDVTGKIVADDSATAQQGRTEGVRITGGRSSGSCIVDRATGLPLQVNRSRYLNLSVTDQNGFTVEQDKHVRTTIQTFPHAGTVAGTGSDIRPAAFNPAAFNQSAGVSNGVQQAGGLSMNPSGTTAIQRAGGSMATSQQPQPFPARTPGAAAANPGRPLSSTVQAVYPD